MFVTAFILSLEQWGEKPWERNCSAFVLVWAPHSPKCVKVSAIQTWKMDEDNGALLTIFLINCQSNCCMNDTNIIWHSIPYQRSRRCSFLLWLNVRPVLPSYYHHHHSDMKGEKQVLHHCQGETLILEHLHSPPSSNGCMKALPRCSLIGRQRKAGILLMLKESRLSPSPSIHCHTHMVALGGSLLCWLLLLRRHLQYDFHEEKWNTSRL